MSLRLASVVVSMACALTTRAQSDLPAPLQRALEARRRIRTAVVELMRTRPDGVPVFYTARVAPEDAAWFHWGDPEGIVGDDPDRQGRPHSVLRQKSALWSYDHDRAFAAYYATPQARMENVPDLRSLGLMFFTSYEDPQSTLARLERAGARSFTVREEDGLQVVTAHTEQGDVTWWIDPQKDSQPIRVQLRNGDRVVREARIELEQIDGVWFPTRVENLGYAADGRVETHRVTEVFYAEFNHPDHPDRLTPNDIGLEPGVLVTRYPAKPGDEAHVWDGQRMIPLSQYRGTFPSEGDTTPADWAPRARGSIQRQIERKLSAWEKYTRDFIQHHRLDRLRASRAWRWLRDCQRLAHKRVNRVRDDISALDKASRNRRGRNADRRRQRVARLMADLDRIFEQRLKPGLRRLLTPAERRAEEQRQRPTP